jgi:catechol 2,3-dioxygenase-like lactoylglutathione lyase family enzyme
MAKIRHIALTTENPSEVAEFYKEAFDMQEIRRSEAGAVFLTDGYINLAILNWKTEKDADVGPNGANYNGIHHIGFQVDDLDNAAEKLDKVDGLRLNQRHDDATLAQNAAAPRNFEMKWAGPDGVVIDVSKSGWATS